MTKHHILYPCYEIGQARDAIGSFRTRSSKQLKHHLAFVELCQKYAIDPNAPDAIAQLELKISERGRPLSPLTDEQVEAYIRS